ncbi:MAG: tyrosine-type recombinase/integrase [Acidimicrobiia bacterium]|nr:tyrosine-type recombinase/integrase [Acidimicrobiia bacterium]
MECAGFTDYLNGRGLDQRTIAYYVGHCRKAEAWLLLHGANLDNCRATVLAEWSRTLPNSHSTRGQVAAALRHYWHWVERPNPPAAAIRVPPQPEMVCRTLESDETRNLVKVALGWWPQGTAVLIGLYLALRRFEIAKAEWSRFDDEFAWYTVTGKRSKTATLPVHPILKSELVDRDGAGWLFPGRLAGHVNPATIGQWIGEVACVAGVENLTPHRLRHTSLTWANDRMGDLRAVQAFARHSNPQVTAGYTRTKVTTLQAVSRSLDYLESNDVRPGNSGNSCPCGSGGDAE